MIVEDDEDISKDAEDLLLVRKKLSSLKDKKDTTRIVLSAINNLSEAVQDLAESTFDGKDLSKSFGEAMEKLSDSLLALSKEQKVDMTPFTKVNEAFIKSSEKGYQSIASVMLDLQAQNKELIKTLSGMGSKPETKDEDNAMLKLAVEMIKDNSEILKKIMSVDYSKQLAEIAKRPTAWVHKVHYVRGKVDFIDSEAK